MLSSRAVPASSTEGVPHSRCQSSGASRGSTEPRRWCAVRLYCLKERVFRQQMADAAIQSSLPCNAPFSLARDTAAILCSRKLLPHSGAAEPGSPAAAACCPHGQWVAVLRGVAAGVTILGWHRGTFKHCRHTSADSSALHPPPSPQI